MEHFDDIEKFAKGNRISTDLNAQKFPKGTLAIANDNSVWVNTFTSKSERLFWESTPINKNNFDIIKFKSATEDYFVFGIYLKNFSWDFKYNYEADSFTAISYGDEDEDYKETFGSLGFCSSFFNNNFDIEKFAKGNKDPDITGYQVYSEVRLVFEYLRKLLDEKKLRFPEPKKPEPKFKVGDKVVRTGGTQVMSVVNQIYDDNKKMFDYDLEFEDKSSISYFEDQLEFAPNTIPKPKFKINDKVLWDKMPFAKFRVMDEPVYNSVFGYYVYKIQGEDDKRSRNITPEGNISLIKETPKFKVGDKVKIPKSKQGVNFTDRSIPRIIQRAINSGQEFLYINEIRPDYGDDSDLVLSDILTGTTGGDYYSSLTDNIELYEMCEADPKDIQSGQVKAFYDRNKTRIDNLESNFSCKIVQALVSLSEYEKCGSPSSATLGKAKTDLLSKISKLKA
jgi:hypothetical protein